MDEPEWADICGLSDVLLDVLHLPTTFSAAFFLLRQRSGVLLCVSPGRGKTLLARCVAPARHCELILVTVKDPELLNK